MKIYKYTCGYVKKVNIYIKNYKVTPSRDFNKKTNKQNKGNKEKNVRIT